MIIFIYAALNISYDVGNDKSNKKEFQIGFWLIIYVYQNLQSLVILDF